MRFVREGYLLFESVNGVQPESAQVEEINTFRDGLYLALSEDRQLCEGIATVLGPIWDHVAIIGHIAVNQMHRRRRIGSKLVHAVIEESKQRGIKRICLQTDPRCTQAIGFWLSLGFQRRFVDLDGYLGTPNPIVWLDMVL